METDPLTTGDPEPQTELIRELILTGEMEQLKGLMELEEGPSRDRIFKFGERMHLLLFGPIERGVSVSWLVCYGYHQVLSGYRDSTILSGYWDKGHRTLFGSGRRQFSVSLDMTLQQLYDYIAESRADPCEILHVAQVRALLHRLGFCPADPGEPSPHTAPPAPDHGLAPLLPRPEEPQPGDPLDRWFDWRAECKALGYQVTLREIATKAGYAYDTVKKKHALYMAERRP
jgi:hypothetical protein